MEARRRAAPTRNAMATIGRPAARTQSVVTSDSGAASERRRANATGRRTAWSAAATRTGASVRRIGGVAHPARLGRDDLERVRGTRVDARRPDRRVRELVGEKRAREEERGHEEQH